jgi:hypothetical protein
MFDPTPPPLAHAGPRGQRPLESNGGRRTPPPLHRDPSGLAAGGRASDRSRTPFWDSGLGQPVRQHGSGHVWSTVTSIA